ncbi:hypothetical protein H6P81_006243 [Aristolochia fimbriata]|uniref:Uncharacterized protein n=1 Tax=Aristolochia fimbriata TaxID=158543 RepID=A0AAV7EY60_ARIFI|nr:hypothetical protein H6P81_006243 [Aristolochia fimbriata]
MDDDKLNLDIDRRLSLIDVSSVDDCLIDSVSDASFLFRSSVTSFPQKVDPKGIGVEHHMDRTGEAARTKVTEQMELLPVESEPSEAKQFGRAPKCNLRKSLAWDNAFFTSEGVLDAEELAMVTKTSRKAVAPSLPGIEEDLRRSTESNTTIGSESWALESIEVDLFDHLRASVRCSGDESDKTSDVSSSSSKAGSSKLGPSSCSIPRKQDLASRNKIKRLPAASKRQSISNQSLNKISKESLSHPQAVQGPHKSRDQKPSVKPPKFLSRTSPLPSAPSKRTSIAAHGLPKAKVNCGLPRLAQSRSEGTSSMSTGKSTSRISGNKAESRSSIHPSSGSTTQTSIRSSIRKVEHGKLNASLHLVPPLKLSTLSPSSSIDGMSSSESSSSTPTTKRRVNKISFHTGSSFSAGNALESIPPRLKNFGEAEGKGMTLGNEVVSRAPLGNALHPQSSAMDSHRAAPPSTSASRLLKPSGLRLPSPKIGFFDANKLVSQATSGSLQSQTVQPSKHLKSPGVGNLGEAFMRKSYNRNQSEFSASGMKPATSSPIQKQSNSPAATSGEVNVNGDEILKTNIRYCDQGSDFIVEQQTAQNVQKNDKQHQPVEHVLLKEIISDSTYEDDLQVLVETKPRFNEQNLDQLSSIGSTEVNKVKSEMGLELPSLSALDAKNSTTSVHSKSAFLSRELPLHGSKVDLVFSSSELTCPADLGMKSPSMRTPLSVKPSVCNVNGSYAMETEVITQNQIDKTVDPTSKNDKETQIEVELKRDNMLANSDCEGESFWSEKENNLESSCYSLSLP